MKAVIIMAGLSVLVPILLIGCGSTEESVGESVEVVEAVTESRVLDRDVILSSDDLVAVGLKAG